MRPNRREPRILIPPPKALLPPQLVHIGETRPWLHNTTPDRWNPAPAEIVARAESAASVEGRIFNFAIVSV